MHGKVDQQTATVTLKLKHCVPYEPRLNREGLDNWRNAIDKGQPLPPVTFAPLEDGYALITQGNHRCRAAIEAGRDTIEGRERTEPPPRDAQEYLARRGVGKQAFLSLEVGTPDEQTQASKQEKHAIPLERIWRRFAEKMSKRSGS